MGRFDGGVANNRLTLSRRIIRFHCSTDGRLVLLVLLVVVVVAASFFRFFRLSRTSPSVLYVERFGNKTTEGRQINQYAKIEPARHVHETRKTKKRWGTKKEEISSFLPIVSNSTTTSSSTDKIGERERKKGTSQIDRLNQAFSAGATRLEDRRLKEKEDEEEDGGGSSRQKI